MNKIKELIVDSRLTYTEISRRMGTSHVMIVQIMDGTKKDIKMQTAFKLADALGVDVNEFRE